MNKAFEKIIDKLEERTYFLSDCTKYGNKDAEQQNKSYSTMMMYEVADLVDDVIEIVKQEADMYNVMIDGEYCFQSCGCTEMCGKCSRIANGDTDYYESICAFSEQTNADRIRSFSDEELAEFLSDPEIFSPCKNCDFHFVDAMNDDCKAPDGWICTKGYAAALIQKWLQS